MKLGSASKIILSCLALAAAGAPSAVRADQPGDYLHTRTYIGVLGTSVSVGNKGEFSGTNYSRINSPAYEIDLIPSLGQNFGFGFLIGHREEAWAAELTYWDSSHTATFGPGTIGSVSGQAATLSGSYKSTAVYQSVNLDFKRYFLTENQAQPFISLGVSFPWIRVDNAAINAAGDTTSLTLAGLGLNLGVGVEYYLSPALSFTAGAYQRWASFDESKGFSSEFNTITQYGGSTTDEGGGLNFAVGTTLGFE